MTSFLLFQNMPVYGPFSASGEAIVSLEGEGLVGGSLGGSVGIGTKVDINATVATTETHWSFNIFEAWDSFVDWLGF